MDKKPNRLIKEKSPYLIQHLRKLSVKIRVLAIVLAIGAMSIKVIFDQGEPALLLTMNFKEPETSQIMEMFLVLFKNVFWRN